MLLSLEQFGSFAPQRYLGASESFKLSPTRRHAGISWDLTNSVDVYYRGWDTPPGGACSWGAVATPSERLRNLWEGRCPDAQAQRPPEVVNKALGTVYSLYTNSTHHIGDKPLCRSLILKPNSTYKILHMKRKQICLIWNFAKSWSLWKCPVINNNSLSYPHAIKTTPVDLHEQLAQPVTYSIAMCSATLSDVFLPSYN